MPRLTEAMKDVISCDKFRVGANNRLIRKFPNGATQHVEDMLLRFIGEQTQGTETSKYLEEKKTIVISRVVASEMEIAQTILVLARMGL